PLGCGDQHEADAEMWRTFNCGIGFVLIAAPERAAALEQALDAQSLAHWRIGQVVPAQGDVRVRIG
ncbi:AIR synthase-related protein, partial [Xanthomonas arboricola]|uniref:AIR synthase-related protein n=1 Tax=Xanthomonas arboricola TaxID=56448 RepID=UPI0021573510